MSKLFQGARIFNLFLTQSERISFSEGCFQAKLAIHGKPHECFVYWPREHEIRDVLNTKWAKRT